MEKKSRTSPPRRNFDLWQCLLGSIASISLLYSLIQWDFYHAIPFNLKHTLLTVPSSEHLRNWSAFYTTGSHLPGQGLHQAQFTARRWKKFGIADTQVVAYDAQLPMPTGQQRLALLNDSRVLYEAPLVDDENSSQTHGFVPAFYAFGANGNITASYVFANFGSNEDYEALLRANVSLDGKIAVIKAADASPYLKLHGLEIRRGTQIANAAKYGLAGAIMYVDPQNDGPIVEANGYQPFPDGPARPRGAIERGTIGNIENLEKGQLPTIPCLPISYADAIPILTALNGHGPSASELGQRWEGGGLSMYGVEYHAGPSPAAISLNLVTQATIHPGRVHNVIGIIPGTNPDEVIILGNHRDAWGPGAGDGNSGSAALNEVVRSFGMARRRGWRPRRTLIFASFEGEEFGQIGSLAWIREHRRWLNATAVAYLNVVVAASGSRLHVHASPLLYRAVWEASRLVPSPNQTVPDQSVLDVWGGDIGTAGGGDAIKFQGVACVATVDFGFSPALGDNVFPYHTGFDTFDWMDRYGDPGWKYHLASTRMWSLMAAALSEPEALNVRMTDYARAIRTWLDEILHTGLESRFDATPLMDAIGRLSRAAARFDQVAISLGRPAPWWQLWPRSRQRAMRRINQKVIAFERTFYYAPGGG
ncbi:PA domain-containing protein [Penicillium capsulatum]|uniref:PA domain-containing protein n=1 Tax=Penicillium capsulatum TaxID=69766 RepID=A0A9W9LLQ7_9EURO|nr:PA domain-containing protein [Penicillium capsulatum]